MSRHSSDPCIASHRQRLQQRQRAVLTGLGLSLPTAALASAGWHWLSPVVAALLASAIFLIYEALDPLKTGFVHHRRIRPIGACLTFGVALTVAWLTGWAAAGPLVCAVVIAYRYHCTGELLTLETVHELTALKHKLLTLESRDAAHAMARLSSVEEPARKLG